MRTNTEWALDPHDVAILLLIFEIRRSNLALEYLRQVTYHDFISVDSLAPTYQGYRPSVNDSAGGPGTCATDILVALRYIVYTAPKIDDSMAIVKS